MTYTPKDWENYPSTETPITAEELNRIESGISELLNRTELLKASHNLFDKDGELQYGALFDDDTPNPNAHNRHTSGYIPVVGGEVYSISHFGNPIPSSEVITVRYNGNFERETVSVGSRIATNASTRYLRLQIVNEYIDGLQLEMGEVITPYRSYQGITIEGLEIEKYGRVSSYLDELTDRVTQLEENPSSGFSSRSRVPDRGLTWEPLGVPALQVGTSFDGNVYIFGEVVHNGNPTRRIRKSSDSGVTFQDGVSRAEVASYNLAAFAVWDDGSLLTIGTEGDIYRADSFDSEPRKVYQTDTGNTIHRLATSFYNTRDGRRYAFAGEYDHTSAMKTMFYSTDAGDTWDILFEGGTLHDGNNHWHAVAYDAYTDEIWLSEGDGDNAKIYHSRDWMSTYEVLTENQPTLITVFPELVFFGRDKAGDNPGADIWDRVSDYEEIELRTAFEFQESYSSYHFYPDRTHWNQINDEYYILFPTRTPEVDEGYIYGTGDGGHTWHLIYSGPDIKRHLGGIDPRGYLYGTSSLGVESELMRAKAPLWTYGGDL